jgi:hypothetical protein
VSFLVQVNCGDAETRQERACRDVAAVLGRHGFPIKGQVRRQGASPQKWETVLHWRRNALAGKLGPHAEEFVQRIRLRPEDLEVFARDPAAAARAACLDHLARVLREMGWLAKK